MHLNVDVIFCYAANAQFDDVPADDIGTFAEIETIIKNESVLLGQNAYFYCEIVGSQGTGEDLVFSKVMCTDNLP